MSNITITKENAQKAYAQAPDEFKATLRVLLGGGLRRDPFEYESYEELCEGLGIDPLNSLPFPRASSKKEVSLNGAFKLQTVYEEFNRNEDGTLWEPDYSNTNEYKWESWRKWSPSSGCFVFGDTDSSDTVTDLGARLCAKTERAEKHIQKVYDKEFNEFLNPQL